jgi:uncharacterized nucleotidyltransferase DUF6036
MSYRKRPTDSAKNGRSRKQKDSEENLDPWALVWGQPYIDAERLVQAIEQDLLRNPEPDFRTRLLVRDSLRAVRAFWGKQRLDHRIGESPARARITTIMKEKLGKAGFTAIRRRLVANNMSADLEQILDLLGRALQAKTEINIAGSVPTLVQSLTSRPTNDIDIVDEVPAEIRRQRSLLQNIKDRFGLTFGHVQSHYLPANWRARRHFFGDFGRLRAYLVDPYDIFVSKLSSKLERHIDDLRVLAKQLDKEKAKNRLMGDGKEFMDDPYLRPQIEQNWHFVFREVLTRESGEGS